MSNAHIVILGFVVLSSVTRKLHSTITEPQVVRLSCAKISSRVITVKVFSQNIWKFAHILKATPKEHTNKQTKKTDTQNISYRFLKTCIK